MSDTSRFTPLYFVKMFLDHLYYQNKNIIIPEAFLESHPLFEENLQQDLKSIDELAKSNNREKIIEFAMKGSSMKSEMKIFSRYFPVIGDLFVHMNDSEEDERRTNINTFVQCFKLPNIINRDVMKDLMPVRPLIMNGDYHWVSIFFCIFDYILYTKTKHLCIFEGNKMDFTPKSIHDKTPSEMKNDFIFNY